MAARGDPTAVTTRVPGARALMYTAAFVVICAGLRAASALVVPVLAAVFLAIVTLPPLAALRRAGLPRWASLSVMLVVVGALVILLAWLATSSIAEFTTNLPRYQTELQAELTSFEQWLRDKGMDIPENALTAQMDAKEILGWFTQGVTALASVAQAVLFVLLTYAFILAEASSLPTKFRNALGAGPRSDLSRYEGMITDVQRYLGLKTQTNLITGFSVWLICWLLGTPYAISIAFLAFFLNYVPTFGAIIAAIPAVLFTLIQFGWGKALWMVGLQLAINIVVGSVVEPRLFGAKFGLSALVVFLSLVFWGWVLGPVGMFLSVPLTMIAKILLDKTPDLRWVSVMLGR